MKKTVSFLLIAMLLMPLLPLAGLAMPADAALETIPFVDSVGRTVEVPRRIDKVAVSGTLAQMIVFALCPDKLVGVAAPWEKAAEPYLAAQYYTLPVIGQIYGGKTMNLESLLGSGAQIVIDVGEPKKSIAEDFDRLQEQTQIPFVHITATLSTMGEAYRMLGNLLNMPAEAEVLAAYCDEIYAQTHEVISGLEKTGLLYLTGDRGLHVIAKGSYHAEVIDLLSNNLAVVADPSSRGSGNEVDMEQILNWNPEVILFSPDSIYASAGGDAVWLKLDAIKNGKYYEAPFGPDNWLGFPPSVQRCLGMMWLAKLLYPGEAQYDLYPVVSEYFRLFYHSDLTEAQYNALIAHSIGRQQE